MNKLDKTLSLMERMNYVGKPYMLTESQESSSQKEAIRYIEQQLGWSHEKANNFVRIDLRNDITALRDRKIAKFTLGVTRMFCNNELSDGSIISDLNSTLKLLSAHLDEYDRNLNGLSAQELIKRFEQTRQNNLEAEKEELNAMEFDSNSNYNIVPINSFEEAQQYYQYTNPNSRWCLTHMEDMFDSYTRDGINQIYFCLQNGFEDIPPKVGEGAPLDEYGLSMLSIIVNEKGELAYCTTRWNHDNGGSDSSMSAKEISQVVGVNFYAVFKPNNKWQELISQVKQRLANGENPIDVFDWVDDFQEGSAMVKLNGKWNFINQKGQLLSDQWYDWAGWFQNGFTAVQLNRKYNFINQGGQLLSDQWYDWADYFQEGFAKVKLNGKWNFINKENQLLSDQWYDWAEPFKEGFAKVELDEKYNFINQKGQLLSDQWYDWAEPFKEGFAEVELNRKYNFINQEGQLLSDQWYNNVESFQDGFAKVKLNGRWNFINQKGQLLSDQWYDGVDDFQEGFAVVKVNGRWYKLDTSGRLHNMNENKEYKKTNQKMKQVIRLTESDLHRMIKESVKNVLNEASYDKNGNFDAESHNSDLKDRFASVLEKLVQSMEYAINELSYIQTSTTDENISKKARIVINDLLNRGTLARQVYSSVKAGRLDI